MYDRPEFITIEPGDEYFIALCNQIPRNSVSGHSFLMLGAMPAQGEPKLLARIGKGKVGYDSFYTAALRSECFYGTDERPTDITYQAYAIDSKQVFSFFRLIYTIEELQQQNEEMQKVLLRDSSAYMPSNEDGKYVYKIIKNVVLFKPINNDDTVNKIALDAQSISFFNSCRTTAVEIIEWVLKFKTEIPRLFFINLRYQTTLHYCVPKRETFHILPAPPNVYAENLNPEQKAVVTQLYRQLENIPTQKLNDPLTQKKFNALKATYLDIVGQHHLDLTTLLTKITEHETSKGEILFARRSPSYLSQMACKFFDRPVTTKRVFDSIKANLQREITFKN